MTPELDTSSSVPPGGVTLDLPVLPLLDHDTEPASILSDPLAPAPPRAISPDLFSESAVPLDAVVAGLADQGRNEGWKGSEEDPLLGAATFGWVGGMGWGAVGGRAINGIWGCGESNVSAGLGRGKFGAGIRGMIGREGGFSSFEL